VQSRQSLGREKHFVTMADNKPNVLVLGGCGFIGRNLVVYLVKNNLCGSIKVADKALPMTSWLTPAQKEAFEKVTYVQANLSKENFIKKVFTTPGEFDYVFNCAAETKASQPEEDYEQRVYEVTVKCAKAAVENKVKRFIEVSDAAVYSPPEKKAAKEDAKIAPWTIVAKYKAKSDAELPSIKGLDYVIVRPCFTYGTSCVNYIMPRLIIGAVYKQLNEKMKLLWEGSLKLNTVHVNDVVRALWHLKDKGKSGEIYNLADSGDSSQETISKFVANLFGIKYEFLGWMKSKAAEKYNMKMVCGEVNEKHLQPWADMLKAANVDLSPLSPYIDQELLYNKNLSIDGTKVESTGFKYEHPTLTEAACRQMVQEYIDLGIFPKGFMQ
jgi:nucleoside-diphosphate-sugar epimerase